MTCSWFQCRPPGVCLLLLMTRLAGVLGSCPAPSPIMGSGSGPMVTGTGPSNMTAVEGNDVTFTCTGNGTTMEWLINCQPANTTGVNFMLGSNNLTLQSVGRGQNGDNITCVMNDVIIGPAALLTVQYVNVTSISPRAMSYCPNAGLTVTCAAEGNPPPQIRWTSGGGIVSNNSILSLSSGSLVNGTVYTCNATSGAATDTGTITINIEPPIIITTNTSITVLEGESFSISCATSSMVSSLQLRAITPSLSITQSNTSSLTHTILASPNNSVYQHMYDCVAVSMCGNVTNTTTVTVIPLPPTNLTFSSRGSTWLYVTWSHPSSQDFTVFYNSTSSNVENKRVINATSYNITGLSPGEHYNIRVVATGYWGKPSMEVAVLLRTEDAPTPSPSPSPPGLPLGIIIGASVGAAVLIILIIIVFFIILCCCCCFCCRIDDGDGYSDIEHLEPQKRSSSFSRSGSFRLSLRRPKAGDPVGDYRKANGTTHAMTAHPLIPTKGFVSRLGVMRMNDNQLFMEEFGSIPMQPLSARDVSQVPHNKEKNRYENILPYDHTRVKLSVIKWQQGSDYINANYLDGYMKHKAYIGTQGPTPATLGDFWRLIWEEDSRTIVMLTNTQEKGQTKCESYWPTECDRPVSYGPVEVTMTDVIRLADYTIRNFSIIKGGAQKEARLVKQFHFTSWPDHGVPDFPTAMLSMVRCVRVHHNSCTNHGPMVVHCSAGVGRTGTFIVIDSSLQRIYSGEETVDIYGHVSLLRTQRNFMVQTEDQYFFIHEAVAEAVACGLTEVKADMYPQYLEMLEQLDGGEVDTTRIELEFRRLAIDRTEPHRFASATKEANKGKNRFINIMPYEYNRVKLNFMRGVDGSDYINASYVDSYRCQKAFLATQAPLPETMGDFWRMMWLQKSPVLVMLTRLVERSQIRCSHYWPDEGSQIFGNITVELTVARDSGTYVYREFVLTHSEFEETHTVRQLHFLAWPDSGVPSSGSSLLDLLQEVQNLYSTLSTNKPITVMCSSGVGRTGVFIALHIVLERLLLEGAIDIFQTVKMLRIQRPAMVQTLELYHFCYNVLLDHLQHSERKRTASSVSLERKVSLRELTASESSPKLVNEHEGRTSTFGHASTNGSSPDGRQRLKTSPL